MGRHKIPIDDLLSYIKIQIISGTYSIGSQIPSIRRLADKFQLRYNVVRNAIKLLADTGYVQPEKNGFSVLPWRPPDCPNGIPIAIIGNQMMGASSMRHEALLGMCEYAWKWNFKFHLFNLDYQEATESLIRGYCKNMAGAVLLSSFDATVPTLDMPVPTVGLFVSDSHHGRLSTVNIDLYTTARLAVDYFRKRRIRKVRIYTVWRNVFRSRVKIFEQFFRDAGGEITDEIVGENPVLHELEPHIGYLFASDHLANCAAKSYQAHSGKKLPNSCVMLGIDGKSLINEDFERFPTITFDWQQMGSICVDELHRLLSRPEDLRKNISVCGDISL